MYITFLKLYLQGINHVLNSEITLHIYLVLEKAVKGKNYVDLTQPKNMFNPKPF